MRRIKSYVRFLNDPDATTPGREFVAKTAILLCLWLLFFASLALINLLSCHAVSDLTTDFLKRSSLGFLMGQSLAFTIVVGVIWILSHCRALKKSYRIVLARVLNEAASACINLSMIMFCVAAVVLLGGSAFATLWQHVAGYIIIGIIFLASGYGLWMMRCRLLSGNHN